MTPDIVCLLVAALFFVTNVLRIAVAGVALTGSNSQNFDMDKFQSLDPDYLQEQWHNRSRMKGLSAAAGLTNSIAWFIICIPVLQVSWILSRGGRRKLGHHVFLGAVVISASVCELLSRLMTVGMLNMGEWLAKDFNLDNWNGANTMDGTGWRVLQMITMVTEGMLMWIDAVEWLAIFVIMSLIYVSIRTEKEDDPSFSKRWAVLGLAIGFFALFDFAADVLTMVNFRAFYMLALIISFLNTIILLPAWIVMLAFQLPAARLPYNDNDAVHHKLPVSAIGDDQDIV